MTDIDTEVAAFAAELDRLAAVDPERGAVDAANLAVDLYAAETHELAAVALREFVDRWPHEPTYARAVAVGALMQFAGAVLLVAPMDEFDGDDGMLRRLKRLAYAARGLGLATPAGGTGV